MDRNRIRHRAAMFTVALPVVGFVLTASAASPTIVHKRLTSRHEAPPIVKVFARLSTPSVADVNIKALKATGAMASRAEQQQQAARVVAQQVEVRKFLGSVKAMEIGNTALKVGVNGLTLTIPRDKIPELAALPGVLSIAPVPISQRTTSESVPWIGAPDVWKAFKAKGKGVKIGIVDGGIDYTHANFGGPGTVEAYEAINPNVLTPGTFPTAKVKGGIDLAGPTYDPVSNPLDVPRPDANPIDVDGHGSHVAGIAAGIGVPGKIGPGVAPEADLYAIKFESDNDDASDLVPQAIEWALDPNGDGAMDDRMDVINMSNGEIFATADDPLVLETEAASALGVVMVAAAGNAGEVSYTIVAPGDAPSAISVAESIPGGRLWSRATVIAPANVAGVKPNVEGSGAIQLRNTGPISGKLISAVPANGCTPFTNADAFAGQIALVRRGVCTFNEKFLAAQAAGARAIVVYNDAATPTRVAPDAMSVTNPAITIPGVMISAPDGVAIAAVATATAASPVSVTLDVGPDPMQDDRIAPISARGPGRDTSFKPDIAAPGFNIVSTSVGTGDEGEASQGTSMATPHVAGSAALLHQLHPTFTAEAIKALLLNSTVDANPAGPTALTRQGVGVLRVDRAAALTSYATPAGVSFGRLNPTTPLVQSQKVALRDFSGHARTFNVRHVPHQTYPGVSVGCPSSVTVGANQSSDFNITVSFDPRVAPTQGVFDDSLRSETDVDGWCILSDGQDTLRVGYLSSVDPASTVSARDFHVPSNRVTLTNGGPSVGLAQGFTLFTTGKSGSAMDSGNSVTHLGVRHATVEDTDVFKFGIALRKPYEHPSGLHFEMFLDVDNDGIEDIQLTGWDISHLDAARPLDTVYVTAQTDLKTGDGFIDFMENDWDYNDKVLSLNFTTAANADFPGFVPAKFSYRLELSNEANLPLDTLRGTVDMAQEVVADVNDFTLNPREAVEVGYSRAGQFLYVYPGNRLDSQVQVVTVKGVNR